VLRGADMSKVVVADKGRLDEEALYLLENVEQSKVTFDCNNLIYAL
jgi:hypothetical protein